MLFLLDFRIKLVKGVNQIKTNLERRCLGKRECRNGDPNLVCICVNKINKNMLLCS